MKEQFAELVNIMATLRSDGGCPWDIEQTHESLRQYLLEEAYEVIETIDEKRFDDLKEELGDLLLQVIFHAQIAAEENRFTIKDVLTEINTKLIRRHPHVFGDQTVVNGILSLIFLSKVCIVDTTYFPLGSIPNHVVSVYSVEKLIVVFIFPVLKSHITSLSLPGVTKKFPSGSN